MRGGHSVGYRGSWGVVHAISCGRRIIVVEDIGRDDGCVVPMGSSMANQGITIGGDEESAFCLLQEQISIQSIHYVALHFMPLPSIPSPSTTTRLRLHLPSSSPLTRPPFPFPALCPTILCPAP